MVQSRAEVVAFISTLFEPKDLAVLGRVVLVTEIATNYSYVDPEALQGDHHQLAPQPIINSTQTDFKVKSVTAATLTR